MHEEILTGDALTKLRTLADESVQCCVTSPPYFGLRDYGHSDQLGLEKTPEEYIGKLVAIFREVKRVLKKDGTLWLNLGDSYANNFGTCKPGATAIASKDHQRANNKVPPGLKPKDLVGIPWRVAFALRKDGWYLRSDIIWHKSNAMPESIEDRPTKAHEYIFLLTKSPKYFYDADAIREPHKYLEIEKRRKDFGEKCEYHDKAAGQFGKTRNGRSRADDFHPAGKNKRSVWTIATQPYIGAHFAVFPAELPELCIKAGTHEGDIVLDPFLGSGTTAWMAKRLRRGFVGIELNPAYVRLAEKRLAQQLLV